MKLFIYYLQYLFFRLVCVVVRLIPFSVGLLAARAVGRFLYYALGDYRKVAFQNVRAAFNGEKQDSEIKQIVQGSFDRLGVFGFEFMWIPKMAQRLDHYIRVEGTEHVRRALKRGQGVVLIVSHFGNWEWMAVATAAEGLPMHAVARPLRNPFIYGYVKRLRGLRGLKSVSKRGAVREAIKLVRRNQVVAILIDQHERHGSVRVPFFGHDASTPSLPAILAIRRNVTVIPLFLYREKRLPYRMVFYEPFQVIETGNYERDIFENTKQYVQAIEREVKRRPVEWLWMHRRWRDGEPCTHDLTTAVRG
ncbi:MAG: hypothetical protein A3J52_00110 [Omnitrophica bacterium RIFCSPHIGHO2_02_FULL_49_9]|nr:MAG: hypothetical protein A3J52_00110 [Omnitrophica bacterium RIFCSPHIGHO2_02_FULL_49_9]